MLTKTKRQHSSNSRSKSKGSKHHGRQQSIDCNVLARPKAHTTHELKTKVKTQNSVHRHKAPLVIGEIKERNQRLKLRLKRDCDKVTLSDDSQLPMNQSQSQTERHNHSLSKVNKTQAAYEEDLEGRLEECKALLSQIARPRPQISQLRTYFRQIERILKLFHEPLRTMFSFLHNLYVSPLEKLFDIILPFEALLIRRQQLNREVENQIKQNQRLYQQQCYEKQNQEILKLREVIDRQRRMLDEKSDVFERYENFKLKSQPAEQMPLIDVERLKKNSFKLDIEDLENKRKNIIGYQQQFYSHLQEFSESWRNQALMQKRF